ncbi:hypothetical protein [Streptomyces sp. NPDC047981]|uniref:hypothetical protein n=1 Tax=Streptomyces sp. NPDC047981 TaxID=3154610 RepID=UPI00342BAF1A
MFTSRRGMTALLAAPIAAALLISCSAGGDASTGATPTSTASPVATAEASAGSGAEAGADAGTDAGASAEAEADGDQQTPGPELVRDAFAGLQATLDDSCATDCAYFLGRVHEELEGLDRAMKADPKGPGHFPEPIAWIEKLRTTLAGDTTYPNLKKHQTLLIGTRDRINTWMQDHPDDYR